MKLFDYPGPSFCIQGWPSRIYTDATCLAALLLYFKGVRKGAQSFAAELADPFGLFHSYEFSRFIKKKLAHHHHNPRLADCLLVAGVPLLVVLPSPVSAFENVVRRRCRDEAIIKRGLRDDGVWLKVASACCKQSPLAVIQSSQVCSEPMSLVRVLSRLGLITRSYTAEQISVFHEAAKEMTPLLSEAEYGIGYCYGDEINDYPISEDDIHAYLGRYSEWSEICKHYSGVSRAISPS